MIPWKFVCWKLTLVEHQTRGAVAISRMMGRFSYRSSDGSLRVFNEFMWLNGKMCASGCRQMRQHAIGAIGNMLRVIAIVRGCAAYQQGRAA